MSKKFMTLLFFLCLTSATVIRMPDPVKYGSSVLLGIRDTVTDNHSLRILDPYVCAEIRSLNLTIGSNAGNEEREREITSDSHVTTQN